MIIADILPSNPDRNPAAAKGFIMFAALGKDAWKWSMIASADLSDFLAGVSTMLTYAAAPKNMLVVAVWTILAQTPTYSMVVTCCVVQCARGYIFEANRQVLCVCLCVYSLYSGLSTGNDTLIVSGESDGLNILYTLTFLPTLFCSLHNVLLTTEHLYFTSHLFPTRLV